MTDREELRKARKTQKGKASLLVNFGHYPKLEPERFFNQAFLRISRIS